MADDFNSKNDSSQLPKSRKELFKASFRIVSRYNVASKLGMAWRVASNVFSTAVAHYLWVSILQITPVHVTKRRFEANYLVNQTTTVCRRMLPNFPHVHRESSSGKS